MAGVNYAGYIGGTLGGIGDIRQSIWERKHRGLLKGGAPEQRLRRFTMQDLMNARQQIYGGADIYNQMLPFMMGAVPGYEAEVVTDPRSTAEYEQLYAAAQQREQLQAQRANLKAQIRQARGKEGKETRQALKAQMKDLNKQLRGLPDLDTLHRTLNQMAVTPAQMHIRKKAPTQTDIQAQQIQDMLSSRTLAALRGELPNPELEHHLANEQAQMEEAMRRSLGGDWEASSMGIEARGRFNQYANDQRVASNRADIASLYPEQLAGQQAGYGFAGATQALLGQPSLQGLRFAQGLGETAGAAGVAQQPYAAERGVLWAAGDPWARGLQASGARWASIGGGSGGGAPAGQTQPQTQASTQPGGSWYTGSGDAMTTSSGGGY